MNLTLNLIQLQTIEMRVHMDCVGCESRVKNALQKMRGERSLISQANCFKHFVLITNLDV